MTDSMTNRYARVKDSLDVADNPKTSIAGEAYRNLRDTILVDWVERNMDDLRQALAQAAEIEERGCLTVNLAELRERVEGLKRPMISGESGSHVAYKRRHNDLLDAVIALIDGETGGGE